MSNGTDRGWAVTVAASGQVIDLGVALWAARGVAEAVAVALESLGLVSSDVSAVCGELVDADERQAIHSHYFD